MQLQIGKTKAVYLLCVQLNCSGCGSVSQPTTYTQLVHYVAIHSIMYVYLLLVQSYVHKNLLLRITAIFFKVELK